MIQLYANIYDILPTEGHTVKPVPFEQLADKSEMDHWHYSSWLNDIRENRVKYQLKLHPSGHLGDGNFRYWCLRHLFEGNQLNNFQWGIVPVDLAFFLGFQRTLDSFSIRSEIWDQFTYERQLFQPAQTVYTKRAVIPSRSTFPTIDMATLGQGTHPYVRVQNLKLFQVREL